jgi:hypothetical protein
MTDEHGSPDEQWRVGRVGEMWIPVPITVEKPSEDGGPTLVLRFDEIDGQLECRDVHFRADPGDREVRRSDLRAVSIDDVREEVAATWARPPQSEEGYRVIVWSAPDDRGARSAGVSEDRRTRRRLNDETLRRVLEVYRSDQTGAPTRAVAEAFDVAHRTASLYVQKARAAEAEGRL